MTIEILAPLFRQAKARAAAEGITLRKLFVNGLQIAVQTPPTPAKHRVTFPLIRSAKSSPPLTDEQMYTALNTDEELV